MDDVEYRVLRINEKLLALQDKYESLKKENR